ncbi:hypothetical protein RB195_005150 [Necator americanus]|uniref:Uncharacterized protein n=1 Tax=Necator americanus TaxID=51031 RepID=A0ABR1BN03_NECAM
MRTFASDERTLREENADGLDDEEMSRQWSDGEIYGRVTCNIDTTKSLGTAMAPDNYRNHMDEEVERFDWISASRKAVEMNR